MCTNIINAVSSSQSRCRNLHTDRTQAKLGIKRFGQHTRPDADAATRLWQVQLTGSAKNAFTYQVNAIAKEALINHPDDRVRDLQALESILQVRFMTGGPPLSGPVDADGVGIQRWQTVLYAAGEDPSNVLDFIHFILEHKLRRGTIAFMPKLLLQLPDGGFQGPVQGPWQLAAVTQDSSNLPKPFAALPPRGRRHVIAQLEKRGGEDEVEYSFWLRGGLYPFRNRFDEMQISAAELDIQDDRGNPKQEYIRLVKFASLEGGETLLTAILENCLLRLPIYFMNEAGDDDEVANWILQQASVVPAEKKP